jgi:chromosome segregation ATPase
MTKTEMMQILTEALKQTSVAELTKVQIELSTVSAVQSEIRDLMLRQYERLENEFLAIKHTLEAIRQQFHALDQSKAKLEKEVRSLKSQLKSLQRRVDQMEP